MKPYRPSDFLRAVAERVRAILPPGRATFEWRVRGSIVQLWYGQSSIHYEVGLHRRVERLEVGLHFEADSASNGRLLAHFAQHLLVAKADVSEMIEAEEWDRGWARVYEMFPIEPLDTSFADLVADRLSRFIVIVQPLLDEALEELGPLPERSAQPEGERRGWRRRRG